MLKKSLLIFILTLVLSPLTIWAQTSVPYTNGKYGYKINLPKDWERKYNPSEDDPQLVLISNQDGSTLSVYAMEDKRISHKTPDELGMNFFFDIVREQFPEANYIQSESESIDNQPAIYAKYSYINKKDDYTIGQFYVTTNDMLYILQIFAKTNIFEPFESIGKGILYTFKALNANTEKYLKTDKYGFRISFPEGWSVIADRPPFEAYDNKGGSVIVEVKESNDYKNVTANDLDPEDMLDAIRVSKKDASIQDKQYIAIEGVPTLYVKYQWTEEINKEKVPVVVQHYYVIRNSRLYIIQTIVPLKQFYNYRDKFKASFESFQFTD